MHDKEFRGIFWLLLAMCAFCGMLVTATVLADPGGFSQDFRILICAGLVVGFAVLFALDLFGIWTGHLPELHHKEHH